MDPRAQRKLGTADIMLPALGFGAAPIGNLFGPLTDAEAEATVEAAWSAGIRFFDTSPFYGRTLSEHRIGRVLRGKPRNEAILSTKVGRVFYPPANPAEFAARERNWPHGLHFEYRHDYSYDGIMRSHADSLQRLGMNRIDVLVIHDLDLSNLGEETRIRQGFDELTAGGGMRALEELKVDGAITAIGAGVNRIGTIPRFLDAVDLDFFLVASPYTLMDQPVLDAEFPACETRGIGFVIGQVFASGILATGPVSGAKYQYRDATSDELARAGRLEAVCKRYDVPLAAAAMQFPLLHPAVASIIPGALSAEQVKRNAATLGVPIPAELWHDLKREGLLREDAPTP